MVQLECGPRGCIPDPTCRATYANEGQGTNMITWNKIENGVFHDTCHEASGFRGVGPALAVRQTWVCAPGAHLPGWMAVDKFLTWASLFIKRRWWPSPEIIGKINTRLSSIRCSVHILAIVFLPPLGMTVPPYNDQKMSMLWDVAKCLSNSN